MTRVKHTFALLAALAFGCASGGGEDAGTRPPLMIDAGEDGGAPDAGPMPIDPSTCTSFTCPMGMELSAAGNTAVCSRVVSMRPSAARRYCHFLESHGVFGFSWTPVELVYNCPPGMEYDPNDETGYCLYREVSPPGAVEAACEDFETSGELAFRFPCDAP